MSDGPAQKSVTAYRLTPGRAEQSIRRVSACSGDVIIGDHARERMAEREFDDIDVFRTLRTGGIVGLPEQAEQGEWKCKMVQRTKGGREIGVVVIILRTGRLFVKTVEWEDAK